ncbi:MAG TPA: DUF4214 domain-containing protein [Burkholderiaceae bacterium]|jgi:hypothetical protein
MKTIFQKLPVLVLALSLAACGGASAPHAADSQINSSAAMASTPTPINLRQIVPSRKSSAASYQNAVEQLYVAYFGRPADPGGLTNFENALLAAGAPTDIGGLTSAYSTNPAVRALIDSFGTSKESQTLYGSGTSNDFVTAVFLNVLGRAPLAAGLSYWSGAIDKGSLSKGNAALSIMAGALTNTTPQGLIDGQLITNRLAVAGYFTAQVSAQNAMIDYAGSTAAGSARGMLSKVGASTDPAAFEATVNSTITGIVAVTVTVHGTAATGEALAGALITLTDSSGVSRTTISGTDGTYAVNATGLTVPFVIGASGTQAHNTASFSGTFSGTFTGSASGSFNLTVAPQGLTTVCTITLSGTQYACKGAILGNGSIIITQSGVVGGVSLQGTVTGNCASLSGTWSYSALGLSGNFSGGGTCAAAAQVKMVSVLASLATGSTTVANITPLTTAIAAQLAGDGVATHLSATADKATITANLAQVDAAVQSAVAALAAGYGATGSPISTPLTADGSGYDGLYDNVIVGTFPKTATGGINIFIGPVATQNGCYVNAAGTGCVTYSDPGTQTTTYPNLCGFDIATGAGIACDPSQPINAQPSVTLPSINGDGGIAISGPGIHFGTPSGTTLTPAQCSALSATLTGLLGSSPSSSATSWGSLISLVQSDIAQADAGCALAGISCAALDAQGAATIALLQSYESTFGNQLWGNQCPQ